jgi:polyisoprenoid-binding protein YceI
MPMIATLVKWIAATATVVALVGAGPADALAETMNFKLRPRYSRATFKSDAPLETLIGTTADSAITATLAVDPAKPQDAKGVVHVDMNQVRTGIDKRDADMRSKQYLDTDVEANRWVTFRVTKVEKVKAKFATTFTDHGMQVPQLLFLKVNNEVELETNLVFAKE